MSSQSADTEYLIEIEAIRADLIEEAKLLIESAIANTKASSRPKLIHMCGIPGSGKTTYTDFFLQQNPHYALVQFDSVMEELPGYWAEHSRVGSAAAFKQFELPARIIGYHLLQALVDNRRDVFFDHGALNRQHVALLKAVSDRGYDVEMHYVECSLNDAFARIDKRELLEGRHTPREIVVERHALLQELLPVYKELVAKFEEVQPSLYLAADEHICTPAPNNGECIE
ncbi:MAG: zeta toxin family protein [Candidatus Obscuribacterales bacterium]|nr:zeta toxin family protein [Candidatus Obscuribacterales bacterium]